MSCSNKKVTCYSCILAECYATTGKTGAAVQRFNAVSRRTAKKSLPCAASSAHGNDNPHGNI
jgi:hypothetical protein